MKKSGLEHARTCVYNVNYHIVWSVKYRKAVLKGGIDEALKDMFKQIAAEKDFIINQRPLIPLSIFTMYDGAIFG